MRFFNKYIYIFNSVAKKKNTINTITFHLKINAEENVQGPDKEQKKEQTWEDCLIIHDQ